MQVKAHSSTNIQVLTAVNYSEPISQVEYATWKDVVEKQAVDVSIRVYIAYCQASSYVYTYVQALDFLVGVSRKSQ